MGSGTFHPRFADLPPVLPIFPLPGAVLLPRGKLPLNIFEPRYLNMVQDCLGMGRMIGMVQPQETETKDRDAPPRVYRIGCAGRVSSFAETDDGRILITLTGVIRYRIRRERPLRHGYRLVEPDWTPFRDDLEAPEPVTLDRPRLLSALGDYLARRDLSLNVRALDDVPETDLVTSLAMICPFEVEEKQAILEAPTLQAQADMLQALLEMARFPDGGPQSRTRQ